MDLLDELNRVIGDREQAIGPSYLMTKRAGDEEALRRIWKTSIIPLIEGRHRARTSTSGGDTASLRCGSV